MSSNDEGLDLSIVIPLFNEEENVKALFHGLIDVLREIDRSYEVIMVDDGSTDHTFSILRRLHGEDEKLKIIKFRRNFGQTAAMSAGFDYAKGKVIITMDGDLQNDPRDIPLLLAKIDEGYDLVSGWRKNRKDGLLFRKVPSYLANKIISMTTNIKLHDYGCTLKAYKKEVIENINLYGEMHRFIPALASWMGIKVAEIPVVHHPRVYGKTKYGLSRTIRVILDLISIKFLLSYSTRPIQVFGGLGLGSMFLGTLSGLLSISLKLARGQDITGNPLLLIAVFLFLAGIQLITMGLLGEIIIRVYHESQSKPIYVIDEIIDKYVDTSVV